MIYVIHYIMDIIYYRLWIIDYISIMDCRLYIICYTHYTIHDILDVVYYTYIFCLSFYIYILYIIYYVSHIIYHVIHTYTQYVL